MQQYTKDFKIPDYMIQDTFPKHETFITLPIKYDSHLTILLISHHDTLYHLDGSLNSE